MSAIEKATFMSAIVAFDTFFSCGGASAFAATESLSEGMLTRMTGTHDRG
ncbi:MAG: hypothetical protein ACR2RB_08625 [Gammaproteobacteria bacterium]